jgi:glycosyltransferase involved in cell wall biosynthesis
LHEKIKFDLVHQLNMIGYREPGYLWKLPLPFIWGPIGGFVQTPWSYMRIIGWKNALFYSARNIINAFQMRFSIRVKTAMNRASALIAATIVDQKAIQKYFKKKAVLISEIGVSKSDQIQSCNLYDKFKEFKICWCGRIIGGKCLSIALNALGELKKEFVFEFNIIGDGSERKRCVALSKKLGIDHAVNWHGWIKHEEAIKIISQSDVMLITSIQDSTSSVVLEALNLGVPVICHDLCGFGNVVDDTCGIKISAEGPRKSVTGFSRAIERLMENPAIIQDLSEGAIKRASEFTWERKMDNITSIYNEILLKVSSNENIKN